MKAALLVLVFLCAISASAQVPGVSVAFGLHGNFANINIADETFKDVYGLGYGGGLHFDVKLVMLSVRVSGDYITASPDNDKFRASLQKLIGTAATQYSIDGGGMSIYSGNVNAKWTLLPLPLVQPYLTGGVGLARLSQDELKVTQAGTAVSNVPSFSSSTSSSLNVGVGVDLALPGITLFGEGKYTWIFADGGTSTYIPFSIGITF